MSISGAKTIRWTAEDWMGVWAVAVLGGGIFAFRMLEVQPLYTIGMCAAANAPAICTPRHIMLVAAYMGFIGWAAVLLGLLAFFRANRFLGAIAIGIGIAAVVNYDGTRGIIGASFGLIAWLTVLTGRVDKA